MEREKLRKVGREVPKLFQTLLADFTVFKKTMRSLELGGEDHYILAGGGSYPHINIQIALQGKLKNPPILEQDW